MKQTVLILSLFSFCSIAQASDKDSTINYNLPDSVKAVTFLADIRVHSLNGNKSENTGIKAGGFSVTLNADKKSRWISYSFPGIFISNGIGAVTEAKMNTIDWTYKWELDTTYRLLIAQATDSAGNFGLYSGYIFLPKENQWKYLGTSKLNSSISIQTPAAYSTYPGKMAINFSAKNIWCQRSIGGWKNLEGQSLPAPTVNLLSHVDSLKQYDKDIKFIQDAIASGKTDVKDNVEGVYYKMMKEGTGKQVALTDTVTVYYKRNIFNDGSPVEGSEDKPATFPLNRLIKGWQLGVPLCKVGGKIKLVIPSAHAYSIRTRAPKIPPNSILVFEVEVLDAKPEIKKPAVPASAN